MYAVIKTGGKQYKVAEGDVIDVELLGIESGNPVQFNEVLFVFDGTTHLFGEPSVNGFIVDAEVIGQSAGPKVQGVKYQPRKRNTRKFGHRQHYSRVKINKINKLAKD